MGNAIGELLPLTVAIAVGPLPIIAIMLILASEQASAKGVGFVAGRLAALGLLVGAALIVFSIVNDPALGHRGHPAPAASIARIAIGLVLVGLAVRKWRRRDADASEPHQSPLTRRVDGLTTKGAFGLGLVVTVVDPAGISIGVLAGLDIAAARAPAALAVLVAVAFVVLATLTVTIPLLAYLAGGDAARRALVGVKEWLLANEQAVMMVLFLLVGAMLIGRGIRELALG